MGGTNYLLILKFNLKNNIMALENKTGQLQWQVVLKGPKLVAR